MDSSFLLDNIWELLNKNNISGKQLCRELGISNSSFTDWKKGKGRPSLETVSKIADYFNVSIDQLVYGSETPVASQMDFSSPEDQELLDKFHSLPLELRSKVLSYIDGMLAALPKAEDGEKRLSG